MSSATHDKPSGVPILEYGLLLLLATLWGASFSFLKLTVASIPPLTAISWRTGIAGLVLYLLLRWQGMRLPSDWSSWRGLVVVAAVNTVFPFILIAWGLQYVNASLAVILNSTTPIFAFLITWGLIRQETISHRRALGVAIGLAGIVLIIGTSALSGLGQQLLPQLALVVASVSYATSAIYGRTLRVLDPQVVACGSLLVGAAVLTPMALVVEAPLTISPTRTSVTALVVLAVLCTALGNVLFFRLLGTLGSLGTTAQSYLRVPIGVLAGIVLVGEELTSTAGIGLVCVVIGVMAMTWPADRPFPLVSSMTRGAVLAVSRSWRAIEGFVGRLPPRVFDYVLLVIVATLWAGSYIWVKIGLESIPPLTLMTGRIVIAGVMLHLVLNWQGAKLPRGREIWSIYATQGMLGTVVPFVLVAWGQQWVDAGPTAILNSVSPVFAFLITWAITRHEPATALKLFGVAAGLAGVIVVIGPASFAGGGANLLPQIAIVVSALSYALAAINSHRLRAGDPVVNAAGSLSAAAAIVVPFTLVIDQPWTIRPSATALGAMLALGVMSTGLGFILYFRLVRSLGSIGVTAQSYLRAPIGVLLAALLLGESVTLPMLAGMALVVVGVWAMTREGAAEQKAKANGG